MRTGGAKRARLLGPKRGKSNKKHFRDAPLYLPASRTASGAVVPPSHRSPRGGGFGRHVSPRRRAAAQQLREQPRRERLLRLLRRGVHHPHRHREGAAAAAGVGDGSAQVQGHDGHDDDRGPRGGRRRALEGHHPWCVVASDAETSRARPPPPGASAVHLLLFYPRTIATRAPSSSLVSPSSDAVPTLSPPSLAAPSPSLFALPQVSTVRFSSAVFASVCTSRSRTCTSARTTRATSLCI